MTIENRIKDFIMNIETLKDPWQVNCTYHSIKATIRDYKKYDQPYNENKVNFLLPKMEMKYRDWEKNQTEKNKSSKRNYSPTKIIIKELKKSKE
jgi:hypothetical protein